jgi:hypothetical protein
VVYLEEEGWSLPDSALPEASRLVLIFKGICTWRMKDGLYPDGGLPGASRLILILKVVYLEEEF